MHTLLLIHSRFSFERVFVEQLLKLFIGEVDAKLFEGISHEDLKPIGELEC